MSVEFFKLYQGEGLIIPPLRIQNPDCTPYDLTGVTEIQARFRKVDGTALIKTLVTESPLLGGVTILSVPLGRIQIQLSPADTKVLKVGERQDFTIVIFKGAIPSVTVSGVVIKANEPGTLLNGLDLVFDGVADIDTVVENYNQSVNTEREIHIVGDGSIVPAAGTETLTGGTDNKRVVNYFRSISVLKPSV